MIVDIGQVTATTVTILAPFMPFLVDAGKGAGLKLAEVIGEMGGEAAWKKAQALWGTLTSRFGNDPELASAATMVATKPRDEIRQTMLAEVLGARLKENPDFAEEIFELLGGQPVVQQVLAERGSWVENVTQQIAGSSGNQSIVARDNSRIRGVNQRKQ